MPKGKLDYDEIACEYQYEIFYSM